MTKIHDQILDRQAAARDFLNTKRELWDKVEMLFHNQLNDLISGDTKSRVFDPKLSTLTLERAYRVMSQLAAGKVKGVSKNDKGDAMLKNLILDKYIVPNANAQFDLLTKFRMVDVYSNIYGAFFVMIDWDVKPNGYVGPDMWLLNIRDVFPQVGATSIDDSDYIITRTWKPLSYFEGLKDKDGFKNVNKVISKINDKAGSKEGRDSNEKSKRAESEYPEEAAARKSGYFEVLSQFEKDRWVDFCVDADMEFRDIKNPHDDFDLPVKVKYSIPLIDDFFGMGDFERGGSMQMLINSTWNLYLDGIKKSLKPPKLINKDNIASMSSIRDIPGADWLVRGPNINNTVQPVNVTPQGINSFNNTYQVANAAILNLFGATDTAVTTQTDPAFGRTPQALKQQQARENTRDNADRFFMEKFVESVYKKFVNLLSKKQSSAIQIRLFEEEIQELSRSYKEIEEMYDEDSGRLSIPKGKKQTLYDYEIVSGSTFAIDQKEQQENMQLFLQLYVQGQTPQGNWLAEKLKEEGFEFKFGELFKRIMSQSGIQDWDKILEEMTPEEQSDQIMSQAQQGIEQAIQQMQGGGSINQVPPEQGINGQQPNIGFNG